MDITIDSLRVLDMAALMSDLTSHSLPRGQVGTIEEDLGSGTYELEFVDESGAPIAIVPVPATQLMGLHMQRPKAS